MCAIDNFTFNLVRCETYFIFINCVLTFSFDSALWLVAQVRIHFHSGHSIFMF